MRMKAKATFLVGFGAGYVLGARAGRERYEALARSARRLMESPAVQEAAGVLQAQAVGLAGDARRAVTDAVSQTFSHRGSDPSYVPAHNGHGA